MQKITGTDVDQIGRLMAIRKRLEDTEDDPNDILDDVIRYGNDMYDAGAAAGHAEGLAHVHLGDPVPDDDTLDRLENETIDRLERGTMRVTVIGNHNVQWVKDQALMANCEAVAVRDLGRGFPDPVTVYAVKGLPIDVMAFVHNLRRDLQDLKITNEKFVPDSSAKQAKARMTLTDPIMEAINVSAQQVGVVITLVPMMSIRQTPSLMIELTGTEEDITALHNVIKHEELAVSISPLTWDAR